MPKAKTINLLLNDGTLKGVISMEDSSWNKGEMYSAPRESVESLISTDACCRYGVYLLLSEDMVYVGQASDLAKRIKQHIVGKSWWERVVILTTSDDSLNRADLDYIESFLIAKASRVGRLDCDNKNVGNKQKLSRFREVEIQQYLEEALFLLELIGINVFTEMSNKKRTTGGSELIPSMISSTDSQRAIREKKEAIQFLNDGGFSILKNVNYASRQEKKEAIEGAGYQCEHDSTHTTFIAKSTGQAYMEGHHLIPMKYQAQFDCGIDVYANVVCLCPTCHRLLHFGCDPDRRYAAEQLFDLRNERLIHSGIDLSKKDFLELVLA